MVRRYNCPTWICDFYLRVVVMCELQKFSENVNCMHKPVFVLFDCLLLQGKKNYKYDVPKILYEIISIQIIIIMFVNVLVL